MNEAALIKSCISLISSFNADRTTPTSHADAFIVTNRIIDENDAMFIRQVFYGCERYKNLISITLDSLYHLRAAKTLRTDLVLYQIFVYFSVVRLSSDLTFDNFRDLVLSQEPSKTFVLLQFLWDEDIMQRVLREIWATVYDINYVDETLLGHMNRYRPEMDELLFVLEELATGRSTSRSPDGSTDQSNTEQKPKQFTVPQPFNLTQPQPRILPEPTHVFSTVYKSNPVPEEIYSVSLEEIEANKAKRRQDIKQNVISKYSQSSTFELQTQKRPSNIQKIREEVQAEREKELNVKYKANAVPEYPVAQPVRLTAAAILREDAMYRRRMENESKMLKAYQIELRDAEEYQRWQSEMKAKDEEEKLAEIERRRAEMAMAAEVAKAAVAKQVEENSQLVASMRQEAEKIRIAREKELQLAQQQALQQAKAQKAEIQQNLQAKKSEILEQNKKNAEEVQRQYEEDMKAIAQAREKEIQERRELIRQIQAIEREANLRAKIPKDFDPTQSSGVGVLEEMSLFELRQRIELLREQEQQDQEAKRQAILKSKAEKEDILRLKMKNISRLRAEAGQTQALRKAATKAEMETQQQAKQAALEQSMVTMYNKLEKSKDQRRQEALRLAAEIKATKIERHFLNADKAMLEEKKLKELQKGAERATRQRQLKTQAETSKQQQVRLQDRRTILMNHYQTHKAKADAQKAYDTKLAEMQAETEEMLEEDRRAKEAQAASIRNYHQQASALLKSRNGYATKISEATLKSARERRPLSRPSSSGLAPVAAPKSRRAAVPSPSLTTTTTTTPTPATGLGRSSSGRALKSASRTSLHDPSDPDALSDEEFGAISSQPTEIPDFPPSP